MADGCIEVICIEVECKMFAEFKTCPKPCIRQGRGEIKIMAAYIAFIPLVGFNADVIDQYMCAYPQTDLVAAFGQQGKAIGKPPGACVKERSYRGIGTVGTVAKGDIFLQGMHSAAVNQEAFQVQAGAAGD